MRNPLVIACSVCVLVAVSTLASAQGRADVECRKTETQPECFARLKCKAGEELEACQKRLRAEPATSGGNGGQRDDAGRGDRGRDANDGGRDRDDRGDRGDREDGRSRDRDASERDREERGRREGSDRRGGRRDRRHGGSSRSFEANKTFGLGLELGEPTGLNGKVFVSGSGAIDFGVGWIYNHYYYGDGVHLYADYLWHPAVLASTPAFELPFYIGVGARYWDFHYCVQRVCDYGGSAIGLRVPVGLAFDFNNAPLDIFVELVPVLDFLGGDYYNRYNNRAHFGFDGSVGFRFWFK